jgi:hypothetical protein
LTTTRPRYARLAAAGSSVLITLVALLGGVGVLPTEGRAEAATNPGNSGTAAKLAAVTIPDSGPSVPRRAVPTPTGAPTDAPTEAPTALPADTGTGKRVVFDISDQRVWLVDPDSSGTDRVARTYLVSGSVTDNLSAGSYEVYSRSRWAVGIDDSGVMEYFVRFTRGARAAIGFHSIPTKDGRRLQTRAQLGSPQSHGCIRQALPDAKLLWDFAPVGTKVVVTD